LRYLVNAVRNHGSKLFNNNQMKFLSRMSTHYKLFCLLSYMALISIVDNHTIDRFKAAQVPCIGFYTVFGKKFATVREMKVRVIE